MIRFLIHRSRVFLVLAAFACALSGANVARAELFSATVYAVQNLENEDERTTSVAFSPDGALISWAVSGAEQGELFWGYDNFGLKWTKVADINLDGATVSFSSGSTRLAVASLVNKPKKNLNATLEMFDTALSDSVPLHIVQVPRSLWKIALPKYSVSQTVFSPDNTLLAGVCSDYTVRVWNVADGKLTRTFKIAREGKSLVFDARGDLVVACGAKSKGELQWWNPATSKLTRKIEVGAAFESLFAADDGETLLSSDNKGVVTLWKAASGAKIKTVTMQNSATKLHAISNDGAWFAGFVEGEKADDLMLAQWSAETGALRLSYSSNRGPQRPIAFSPDTKHLAIGGVGGTSPDVDHAMLNVWPVSQ